MANYGIQPGSLILPSADYLVKQFRKDPTKPVLYEEIAAELKRLDAANNPTREPNKYRPRSIKDALHRYLDDSLILTNAFVCLAGDWDPDALDESVQILHKQQEGRPKQEKK